MCILSCPTSSIANCKTCTYCVDNFWLTYVNANCKTWFCFFRQTHFEARASYPWMCCLLLQVLCWHIGAQWSTPPITVHSLHHKHTKCGTATAATTSTATATTTTTTTTCCSCSECCCGARREPQPSHDKRQDSEGASGCDGNPSTIQTHCCRWLYKLHTSVSTLTVNMQFCWGATRCCWVCSSFCFGSVGSSTVTQMKAVQSLKTLWVQTHSFDNDVDSACNYRRQDFNKEFYLAAKSVHVTVCEEGTM